MQKSDAFVVYSSGGIFGVYKRLKDAEEIMLALRGNTDRFQVFSHCEDVSVRARLDKANGLRLTAGQIAILMGLQE